MQAEVDEAVRETDRLRAENAALEESLCEVADAMSKSLPTRDRVSLTENGPDSVPPVPADSPQETPHHRLPGEEGFESAGVSNSTAVPQEDRPDDASTAAKSPPTTAARVSANLEVARADALARTNAYLRGLLDNLVGNDGGGDDGGRFSAEHNPAATIPEQEEEEARGVYDDGDGEADQGGRRCDVNGSGQNRRRRWGNTRRCTQRQHEAVLVAPLCGGDKVEERSSPSSSGLSRALRSLVDALQERDARAQLLEDEVARVRRGAVAAAEAASTRAEMESLQASLAATEAERLELETLVKDASHGAEAASRDAQAQADALKAELEASERKVFAVNEERHQIEEALADGQEGLLALREALERTVDAARGLLERAEAVAADAEAAEVETLEAELRCLERRAPHSRRQASSTAAHQRRHSASPPRLPLPAGRGLRSAVDPSSSWPGLRVSSVGGEDIRYSGSRRLGAVRGAGGARHGQGDLDVGSDGGDRGAGATGVEAEAAAHEAATEMEEALFDVEMFVLRQGIAMAADARRREAAPQAESSRQEVSAAVEAEAATERAREARWEAERSSLEARLARLEEEAASVRREADEQGAEVEALKTQRENLVRRVASAEAEAALARAVAERSSASSSSSSSSAPPSQQQQQQQQQGSGGEDSSGTAAAAVPAPSPSALTAVADAVPDH
ncbi:unnamed protein product, partial [Ectocarpus fasciculatus]